jgi:electron transfer flavoprotein alpha subunit
MSVLVYTENWDGKFKKITFELLTYARALAELSGSKVTALSIGDVSDGELAHLAAYGCDKIVNAAGEQFGATDARLFAAVVTDVAEQENADTVLMANTFNGKAIAPRVAVRLQAGLVTGASSLPLSLQPFRVTKKVFSGKAFATAEITSERKVLTLAQNSHQIFEKPVEAAVVAYQLSSALPAVASVVTEVSKNTDKVLLTDAEIVVSGGRGMKSSDNWAPIEELASLLGAATACSRPVSDEHWRSHDEHVGQTGKIIAPNLYFAFGISGAIQHLAGVSSSKVIVAVNTDPEAPIFQAADYGIVGDAQKVLPDIIAAVKEMKA